MKYFRHRYDVTHSNSYQANIAKMRNCSQKLPLECKRLGETKTNCNLHIMPDANFTSTKLGKQTRAGCVRPRCVPSGEDDAEPDGQRVRSLW